jgi:hypothetical protein
MSDYPKRRDPNDTRLLTPLIVMGLIAAGGMLYFAYRGETPVASAPAQQTTEPGHS